MMHDISDKKILDDFYTYNKIVQKIKGLSKLSLYVRNFRNYRKKEIINYLKET